MDFHGNEGCRGSGLRVENPEMNIQYTYLLAANERTTAHRTVIVQRSIRPLYTYSMLLRVSWIVSGLSKQPVRGAGPAPTHRPPAVGN